MGKIDIFLIFKVFHLEKMHIKYFIRIQVLNLKTH